MNLIWNNSAISPYESLWSILHKLSYLNRFTYDELKQILPKENQHTKTGRLVGDFGYVDKIKLRDNLNIPNWNINNSICFEYQTSPENKVVKEYLRFCPKCILQGFHSASFQIESIKLCPIHKTPMRQTCPSCGELISYSLGTPELFVPYGCSCGYVLWKNISLNNWGKPLNHHEEEIFKNILIWTSHIRNHNLKYSVESPSKGPWFSSNMEMGFLVKNYHLHNWAINCFDNVSLPSFKEVYQQQEIINNDVLMSLSIDNELSNEYPFYPKANIIKWFNEYFSYSFYIKKKEILADIRKNIVGLHEQCGEFLYVRDGVTINLFNKNENLCVWKLSYLLWIDELDNYNNSTYFYFNDLDASYFDHLRCFYQGYRLAKQNKPCAKEVLLSNALWLGLQIYEKCILNGFSISYKKAVAIINKATGATVVDNNTPDRIFCNAPKFIFYPDTIVDTPTVCGYWGFDSELFQNLSKNKQGCLSQS